MIYGQAITLGGGDGLNIAYGATPPADTSKLWVPLEKKPSNVEVSGESLQNAVDALQMMVTTVPSSDFSNFYFPSVTVGGKIYQFGGASGATPSKYDTIREYDPATDTLATKNAVLAKKAHSVSAVEINGKIYLFGGNDGSSQYSTLIQEYDPVADTIVTKSATLKQGAYGTSAVEFAGKAYIFGGVGYNSASRTYIQEYDPVTDTITEKIATLEHDACYYTSAVVINGKVYIFGGRSASTAGTKAIQEYDPVTDTITDKTATLETMAYLTATAVINGKAYIFGGTSNSTTYLNAIQEYDPVTDTIITKAITLSGAGMGGYSVAVVDGHAYLWGGRYYYNIQEYTPKAYLGANNLKVFASVYKSEAHQLVTNIVNNKNAQIKLYMTSAFLGDDEGYAKEQEAFVYNGATSTWQSLDGTSWSN